MYERSRFTASSSNKSVYSTLVHKIHRQYIAAIPSVAVEVAVPVVIVVSAVVPREQMCWKRSSSQRDSGGGLEECGWRCRGRKECVKCGKGCSVVGETRGAGTRQG